MISFLFSTTQISALLPTSKHSIEKSKIQNWFGFIEKGMKRHREIIVMFENLFTCQKKVKKLSKNKDSAPILGSSIVTAGQC